MTSDPAAPGVRIHGDAAGYRSGIEEVFSGKQTPKARDR